MNSKRTRSTYYSNLLCKKCGFIAIIPRKEFQRRKQGHIKTMYCPKCMEILDFRERRYVMTLADYEERTDHDDR